MNDGKNEEKYSRSSANPDSDRDFNKLTGREEENMEYTGLINYETNGTVSLEKTESTFSRRINIEFFYLNDCEKCRRTEEVFDEVLRRLQDVFNLTDIIPVRARIKINDIKQAEELKLLSLPAIRVNGKDTETTYAEQYCDVCDQEGICRLWLFRGEKYEVPPAGMLAEHLLQQIYGAGGDLQINRISNSARGFDNDSPLKVPEELGMKEKGKKQVSSIYISRSTKVSEKLKFKVNSEEKSANNDDL